MVLLIAMNGFEEIQKKQVVDELVKQGAYIEKCFIANTKLGVFQQYQEHSDINVILVSEYLEEAHPYQPEELNDIDELKKGLRVIPIITGEHKGSEYMHRLYISAIYDAVFDGDADMSMVAKRVNTGRDKKEARLYYHIEEKINVIKSTSDPEAVESSLNHILNGGELAQMPSRAEYVMNKLTSGEFRLVLEKLSDNYIEVLKMDGRFREYFLENGENEKKDTKRGRSAKAIKQVENMQLQAVTTGVSHQKESKVENVEDLLVEGLLKEEVGNTKPLTTKSDQQKEEPLIQENKIFEQKKAMTEVNKKQISIPVPSFVSGIPKQKIEYIAHDRALVAVIGDAREAGSTFVAYNFAKILAMDKLYNPTLVQLPDTEGRLYETLAFDEIFKNGFVSHMQQLLKTDTIPTAVNAHEGIRFVVPVPGKDRLDKWSYVKSMRLLMKAESPCIVDMGSFYTKRGYSDLIKEITHLLIVVSAKKEPDIEKIRTIKEMANDIPALNILFILNGTGTENTHEDEIRQAIGDNYHILCVPFFENPTKKGVRKGARLDPHTHTVTEKSIFQKIINGCGFTYASEDTTHAVKRISSTQNMRTGTVQLNGTLEVGFMGIERGVGTTFSALLCCYSLAAHYKVAYLEMNKNKHMKSFCSEVAEYKDDTVCFSFRGVDIYFNLSYMEFAARYRNEYDYVIVDFGHWDIDAKSPEYVRTGKRFVVSGSTDWRIGALDRFYAFVQKSSMFGDVTFLFPLLNDKEMENTVKDICRGYMIEKITACKDAYHPQETTIELFQSHLVVKNQESRKKKRRKFFWNR